MPTKTKRKPAKKKAAKKKPRARKPKALKEIIKQIPGYDPNRDSKGYHFDEAAARLAIEFFPECLSHVKGELAGRPFDLRIWQQGIIGNLFGWKDADGFRRYREAFILVPRKNGKTTLVAGLASYVLFCDHEMGAEIYSAAADRDQAALCFEQAKKMILNDEYLASRAKIFRNSIVYEEESSFYKAISAEAGTKHGYNSHLVLIDELHAQPTRELVDVLETSTGSRRQPLVIHITTSDYERPSICNEKLDYAEKIRDGIIKDATFLPVIYKADIKDDWTSLRVWKMANPNYGVSLKPEYLKAKCKKAQEMPTFENTFKRLHLNIKTEQAVRWIPMDKWDECQARLNIESLAGLECWAGLDLSSTRDITALVLFFPGKGAVLPFFWIPKESAVAREKRDRVPYITWARQGFIEMTEGNSIDYRYIRERVNALGKLYSIQDIGVDPYNATHISTQLGEEDGFEMISFRQGTLSMNEPSKELERRVVSGELNHGGNPVLRWMASNVVATTDQTNNIRPDKKKSAEKIDGIVALIMGIGRSMAGKETGSVYDERGILTI